MNQVPFSRNWSIFPKESLYMSSMVTHSISRVDRSMMWGNSTPSPSKSRKILVSNRKSHSSQYPLKGQEWTRLHSNQTILSYKVDHSVQIKLLSALHSTHSNSQSEKNRNTSIRSMDLHVRKVISSQISAHSSMKASSEWIGNVMASNQWQYTVIRMEFCCYFPLFCHSGLEKVNSCKARREATLGYPESSVPDISWS